MTLRLQVGSQIKFAEDSHPYTIRAGSERWAICTRAFTEQDREDFAYEGDDAPQVYTIIDWDRLMRGRHNLILDPFDFGTDEGCQQCLEALEAGDCELSSRTGGSVPLLLDQYTERR